MFYNINYILKDEILIIRTAFGDYGYYGSRFRARCLGKHTYTGPRRGKRDNVIPIQGPVLKKDKHFHYKRDYFNVVLQLLDDIFL